MDNSDSHPLALSYYTMRWASLPNHVRLALHLIAVCAMTILVRGFGSMCALLVEQVPSHKVCDQAQAHCGVGQRAEAGRLQQARLPRCHLTPLSSLSLRDTPTLLYDVAREHTACCWATQLPLDIPACICDTSTPLSSVICHDLQSVRLPQCRPPKPACLSDTPLPS